MTGICVMKGFGHTAVRGLPLTRTSTPAPYVLGHVVRTCIKTLRTNKRQQRNTAKRREKTLEGLSAR
jgi:hypothetical protein